MVLAEALKIKWAEMPTYNTIMAVAAGAGLLLVVTLGYLVVRGRKITPDGWALAFGVLGLILTVTGLHMTLTWPLAAQGFPFDNVIFGEPALAFGVLQLGAAAFLWKRGAVLFGAGGGGSQAAPVDDSDDARADVVARVSRLAGPVSVFVFGMGLGCFGIAAAGWRYTLFAAPPQEPISGTFANVPVLEATFISMLYVFVGVGAVLFPFVLRGRQPVLLAVTGVVWGLAGLAFLFFGGLNYFTHIGLIINTM